MNEVYVRIRVLNLIDKKVHSPRSTDGTLFWMMLFVSTGSALIIEHLFFPTTSSTSQTTIPYNHFRRLWTSSPLLNRPFLLHDRSLLKIVNGRVGTGGRFHYRIIAGEYGN